MNKTTKNADDLKINSLEVVYKSYDLFQMRLNRSHNLTLPRTNLGISSSIKPIHKLVKSLIQTSNKL